MRVHVPDSGLNGPEPFNQRRGMRCGCNRVNEPLGFFRKLISTLVKFQDIRFLAHLRELSAAVRSLKAVTLQDPVMPVADGFLG